MESDQVPDSYDILNTTASKSYEMEIKISHYYYHKIYPYENIIIDIRSTLDQNEVGRPPDETLLIPKQGVIIGAENYGKDRGIQPDDQVDTDYWIDGRENDKSDENNSDLVSDDSERNISKLDKDGTIDANISYNWIDEKELNDESIDTSKGMQ